MRRGGIIVFFLVLCLVGCKERKEFFPYKDLSYSYYDTLRNSQYLINSRVVHWYIDSLRLAERDTSFVDLFVDKYYYRSNPYLWVDMSGADERTDSLLHYFSGAKEEGISPNAFYCEKLSHALARLKGLSFTRLENINLTLATIEYYSTKGYARYVTGMRFGFVNPGKLFNHLDPIAPLDSNQEVRYRVLYATKTETPGRAFMDTLFAAASDSRQLGRMFASSYPKSNNYRLLKRNLNMTRDAFRRRTIAVNMERYRWRTPRNGRKYVWINLPEFMLRAYDDDTGDMIEMRVCEGSFEHKTPLLSSDISRLELNPVWVVPQSIISKEIAPHHAGDAEWFEHKRMIIVDKKSGEEVPPVEVSSESLKTGNYNVIQGKGEGNALGRMIFRFPNDFSIYLHDTPNHEVFTLPYRALSHGCIRLERPLDLAVFLMEEKDPLEIDKMRIAVDLPPESEEGRKFLSNKNHRHMESIKYKPSIPLYITYYTAYPDINGNVVFTSDPYDYDQLIYSRITGMSQPLRRAE